MPCLTLVTTCLDNKDYLEACLDHYFEAQDNVEDKSISFELYVRDFGKEPGLIQFLMKKYKGREILYVRSPGAGLVKNLNAGRSAFLERIKGVRGLKRASERNRSFMVYLNDDAAIHKDFLVSAYRAISGGFGFVGGVPQPDGWCAPVEALCIPEPIPQIEKITDIKRLWWESSACVISVDLLERVGEWDPVFDMITKGTGYISDNDYMIRTLKLGFYPIRNFRMPFWHGKGVTQCHYRLPGPMDKIRSRAVNYMKLKWGVNLDTDEDVEIENCYSKPFDGGKFTVTGSGMFMLNGEEVKI